MHRIEQKKLMAQVRTLSIKIKIFFIVFVCIFFYIYCYFILFVGAFVL